MPVLSYLSHEPPVTEAAPPLLIAHGLYGSARNFNSLGKAYATNRRVVLVDMRNHGDSLWSDRMTYADLAADLAETIDHLFGGPAVVLGHSMGGKAVMALSLTRPDLVSALIVADIAPVPYDHSHAGYIDAMLSVDLAHVSRRSDADPALAEHIPEPSLRSFLLQNLVMEGGRARWRLNLHALRASLPDLMGWPGEWPEPVYDGPTLFVNGRASDYVTPDMHPRIRATFPDVAFETLDNAGHWLHAEQPAAFNSAVVGMLDSL
ncbi:MAG: alpha/beta fold hydrolase [Pseudomonadota bacterium]